MKRKYAYADRAAAEQAVNEKEQAIHLHHIALNCLLRDEFTWTKQVSADNGAWFQMGIARANSAHGGIVIIREFYPTNLQPSQSAQWADSWIREQATWRCGCSPTDNEGQTYWDCFRQLQELQYSLSHAA